MAWDAIYFKGAIWMNGLDGNIDSKYYCRIIENLILPIVTDLFGYVWKLIRGGSSVNISVYTKEWLGAKDVYFLPWPAKRL